MGCFVEINRGGCTLHLNGQYYVFFRYIVPFYRTINNYAWVLCENRLALRDQSIQAPLNGFHMR